MSPNSFQRLGSERQGAPRAVLSCERVNGDEFILRERPTTVEVEDAVMLPVTRGSWYDSDHGWGVYKDGRLVSEAAYRRGPGDMLVGQAAENHTQPVAVAPDDTYVYGGTVQPHIGHFLLSTLSWFWTDRRDAKIVLHGYVPAAALFTLPFVQQIFGALGLTPDHFVHFDQPTRIRRLIVPAPSFIERRLAHTVFGELCTGIGETLLAGRPRQSGPPVYLSKERLAAGIWRIGNEAALSERLAAAGVETIFPETLSLAEQIDLFRSRTVIGTMSSALHLSLFSPEPANMIALGRENLIESNFHLIDRLKNHRSRYFYPTAQVNLGYGASGLLTCDLTDPVGVAEDLLRLLDDA